MRAVSADVDLWERCARANFGGVGASSAVLGTVISRRTCAGKELPMTSPSPERMRTTCRVFQVTMVHGPVPTPRCLPRRLPTCDGARLESRTRRLRLRRCAACRSGGHPLLHGGRRRIVDAPCRARRRLQRHEHRPESGRYLLPGGRASRDRGRELRAAHLGPMDVHRDPRCHRGRLPAYWQGQLRPPTGPPRRGGHFVPRPRRQEGAALRVAFAVARRVGLGDGLARQYVDGIDRVHRCAPRDRRGQKRSREC